jgi:hypothetical protein
MGKLGAIVLATLLGLTVVAGVAYAADPAVKARIVEKDCDVGEVVVKTLVGGVEVTREVDPVICGLAKPGWIVHYHLRSGAYSVWTEDERSCLYDSERGIGC